MRVFHACAKSKNEFHHDMSRENSGRIVADWPPLSCTVNIGMLWCPPRALRKSKLNSRTPTALMDKHVRCIPPRAPRLSQPNSPHPSYTFWISMSVARDSETNCVSHRRCRADGPLESETAGIRELHTKDRYWLVEQAAPGATYVARARACKQS